jgi:hypothetical protein
VSTDRSADAEASSSWLAVASAHSLTHGCALAEARLAWLVLGSALAWTRPDRRPPNLF